MESEDDLSYSFYIDKGYVKSEIINNHINSETEEEEDKFLCINSPPDPFSTYSKRTREKWVDDNSVSKCKACNSTFRMYRRRHHCILEGTSVTLSNGTARKIEKICPAQSLPSWDGGNVNCKPANALLDQGWEPCEKLILEDGREIIATSDHKILAISETDKTPTYVQMNHLTLDHRVMCSAIEGVLDLGEECTIPGINLSDREKYLALARLLGFAVYNAHISDEKVIFLFHDSFDMEALRDDVNILGFSNVVGRLRSLYTLEISDPIFKTQKQFPDFLWDPICSKNIKREFIAAWLSGYKIRFQGDSLKQQIKLSVRNVNASNMDKLVEIMKSFDVKIGLSLSQGLWKIKIKTVTSFQEKIGFRYCINKQSKLSILCSYFKSSSFSQSLQHSQQTQSFIDLDSFVSTVGYNERYYSLKIRSKELYKNGEKQHVYDISVPENTSFVANGILVHNCRACGSSFCDSCTSYQAKIPHVIKKIPTRTGKEEVIDYNTPVRLCLNCHTSYTSIHKLEKLFTVFSLLELDLIDFKTIACVCKQWNMISAFYLSKFREIQYKLPKYDYNSWEKQALWTNRYLLQNHSVWEVHVLRSAGDKISSIVDLYFPKKRENFSKIPSEGKMKEVKRQCWDRMCTRYCRNSLDEERSLLLLDVLKKDRSSDIIAAEICKTFDNCSDYILECYLPYILSKIENNNVLKKFIFSRCTDSLRLSNISYWYLKDNPVLPEFVEILPQTIYVDIIKTQKFVEAVKNDTIPSQIVSVLAPELGEQDVYIDKIYIKESATRPTFIPCSKSSILYKKDDVRKDYIIMCLIRLMEKILKDSGLDIDIVTYNVQPTSESEGFISIVPDCETLYAISEELKTTIINYLLSHNPDESVGKLRDRFKKSCAVYSVIAFLLSISDRNTENLLVTTTGQQFHIDYSYCLGQDPKPLRTSCIRITNQMLDALGGENSTEYEEFKELCGNIYDILRRHVNTFVCILSLVPQFKSSSRTSPQIDEDEMLEEIVKRFCPGETYEDAVRNLKTRIDNSANNSTLSKYHIIDFFHKHKKEKTLGNFIGDAYVGTKYVFNSMYGYLYTYN